MQGVLVLQLFYRLKANKVLVTPCGKKHVNACATATTLSIKRLVHGPQE